ncbi:hypothetical protein RUM44_009501 [Polyplax serrata]|uniref:Uncharacterized protein n=1 Tax=Polyplax serrata TaxID=468196 RepID=A0ABR1ASW4_POLSC
MALYDEEDTEGADKSKAPTPAKTRAKEKRQHRCLRQKTQTRKSEKTKSYDVPVEDFLSVPSKSFFGFAAFHLSLNTPPAINRFGVRVRGTIRVRSDGGSGK